jgi:hypothetical protein
VHHRPIGLYNFLRRQIQAFTTTSGIAMPAGFGGAVIIPRYELPVTAASKRVRAAMLRALMY